MGVVAIGNRFGRLTVIGNADSSRGNRRSACVCDCGTRLIVFSAGLRNGHSRSCGCLMRDLARSLRTTHGHSSFGKRSKTYNAWEHLKHRCLNQNNRQWKNYGGRGIKVCDRWRDSFENFLADMGEPPTSKHTIDRWPNNNGNYEPGNCRWATSEEQNYNKRNTRVICFNGESKNIREWSVALGITEKAIARRIERGLSSEKILSPQKIFRKEL